MSSFPEKVPPLSGTSSQKVTSSTGNPIDDSIDDIQKAIQDNIEQKKLLDQMREQLKHEAQDVLAKIQAGGPDAVKAAAKALGAMMRHISQVQDQSMGVQTSNQDVVNKLLNMNTSLENLKNQATNLVDLNGYTFPPGSYFNAIDLSGKTIATPITLSPDGSVMVNPPLADGTHLFIDVTKPGVLPPGTLIKMSSLPGAFYFDANGNLVPCLDENSPLDINSQYRIELLGNKVLQMNKSWAASADIEMQKVSDFLNGSIQVPGPDGSMQTKPLSQVYPFSDNPSLITSIQTEIQKFQSNSDPVTAWQAGTINLVSSGGSSVTDYINKSQSYQSDVTTAISQAKGNLGGFNQAQITQLQAYQALQKSLIDTQKNMIQTMQGFIKNVTQRTQ